MLVLPAVCLQQDSSFQRFSKALTCMLLSEGEFSARPTCITSFIEVQRDSGEHVSTNWTDKNEVLDTGREHTSSLRLQVWRVWFLGLLSQLLVPGTSVRHPASVLPAGKAAPSASILKTERTGR